MDRAMAITIDDLPLSINAVDYRLRGDRHRPKLDLDST